MNIVNVGLNYRHSSDFQINRPNGSGDYIFLIFKTDAYIVLEGKRQSVLSNSIIIFKKGTPQHYGALAGEYVNDWIHFELDEGEERLMIDINVPFDTVIPLKESAEFSRFVKEIFIERYSQNMYKNAIMRRYFELMILKLAERISLQRRELEHPQYLLLSKLRNDIRLAPQEPWNIDRICQKTLLSRFYVQHLYKLFFGVTIIEDVQIARIEQSKDFLLSTNMTISAISYACGYNNDVHFMRTFKRFVGKTPSQYRKENFICSEEIARSKNYPPFAI